jgi:hypothetical protein
MGSIMAEMDAGIATSEDFSLGATACPYQTQSAAWCFYGAEHKDLTRLALIEVRYE